MTAWRSGEPLGSEPAGYSASQPVGGSRGHAEQVLALRLGFDRSFAERPSTGDLATYDDFLAIGLGGDAHAVRLIEVAGLFVDKPVTGLPGPLPELIGLTGLRGTILPVWDLSALLGYPKSAQPRWLLVAAGAPVALAFDRFEGHLRVMRGTVVPSGITGTTAIQEIVRADDVTRPVIRLASTLERIDALARQRAPRKE